MKNKYKHFNPDEHQVNTKMAKVKASSHAKHNKEEWKKELREEIKRFGNVMFQKGKLEAEEEFEKMLNNLDYGLALEEQNIIVLRARDKIKRFLEQLQKEIVEEKGK